VKQGESIVLGMHYFANMVGHRENSANLIGLLDSATRLMKETTVVTNLEMVVEVDFATYYIVEHYTVETEMKKLRPKTYQTVPAATDGTG